MAYHERYLRSYTFREGKPYPTKVCLNILCRTNTAYVLNNGKVFISAFVERPDQPRQITISVAKDTTTSPDMVSNDAAVHTLIYQPRDRTVDSLALSLGTLMAAANTASLMIGLNSMSLSPVVPAGASAMPCSE